LISLQYRIGFLSTFAEDPYVNPPVEGKPVRGFEGLDVGDRVLVQLIGTDVERGFIDFAKVE